MGGGGDKSPHHFFHTNPFSVRNTWSHVPTIYVAVVKWYDCLHRGEKGACCRENILTLDPTLHFLEGKKNKKKLFHGTWQQHTWILFLIHIYIFQWKNGSINSIFLHRMDWKLFFSKRKKYIKSGANREPLVGFSRPMALCFYLIEIYI